MNKNTQKSFYFNSDTFSWEPIDGINIKKGMLFRIYEDDGKIVMDDHEGIAWFATRDAYENQDGIWTIEYEEGNE